MKHKIILPIFLLLALLSCKEDNHLINKNTISFSKFPSEKLISFKELYDFKEGVPSKLIIVDSVLIIHNNIKGSKSFLYNYYINNNTVSKGYLNKGRGPNEALGVRSIGIKGNTLWVYDVTLKKILTIDKKTAIVNNVKIVFNEYPYKEYFYAMSFKDSLNYFTIGDKKSNLKIKEKNLISDKQMNEFGEFGNIPKNMSIGSYKSAHQSFIFVKPSSDKLVLSYRFTDTMEMFNIKTGKSTAIQGPEVFNVSFEPIRETMLKTDKTRCAFIDGSVTDKYIYLAYSGASYNNPNKYSGKSIYIYDWDGNPIRKLNFKKNISTFTISKDDNTIYAYDIDTGFIINANIN
ncbi:MAG: hypothetical protein IZT56_07965 [Bacteroidetes bacterium]|nr:hypothetical protein [Bacteroidota bacterium]